MALRARKIFGAFEKRAPGRAEAYQGDAFSLSVV